MKYLILFQFSLHLYSPKSQQKSHCLVCELRSRKLQDIQDFMSNKHFWCLTKIKQDEYREKFFTVYLKWDLRDILMVYEWVLN